MFMPFPPLVHPSLPLSLLFLFLSLCFPTADRLLAVAAYSNKFLFAYFSHYSWLTRNSEDVKINTNLQLSYIIMLFFYSSDYTWIEHSMKSCQKYREDTLFDVRGIIITLG